MRLASPFLEGTFLMAIPQWTDEQVIAQLNSGQIWPDPVITYAFPQNRSDIYGELGEGPNFTPLSEYQQAFARLALATWNDLIQANITPVPAGESHIEFGNTYVNGVARYAHAYFPPIGS